MSKFVSACCLKDIISTTKLEYPLGGTTWYESYKVDVCDGCGLEIDEPLEVTECCGEESCSCPEGAVVS